MGKINEVFTTKEVEIMLGYSNQHLRRLLKSKYLNLVDGEDYRKTDKGLYLVTKEAVDKMKAYKGI